MSCVITNIIKMRGIAKLPLYNNGDFDFNKIIPMPTSLDIECGSVTDHAIVCYFVKLLKSYFKNSLDMAKEISTDINKISSTGKKSRFYQPALLSLD